MFYLCFCYNAHRSVRLHACLRFKLVHVAENVQQRPRGGGHTGSQNSAPFQASQYPNKGVLRDEYGSMRPSPNHAHFWRWERFPCRTLAD